MSDASMRQSPRAISRAALARNWRWMMALGVIWIVLGALAIVLPVAAAVAVDLILGALLLAGGAAQLIQAFRYRGWSSALPQALTGLLAGIAGFLLLFFPLEGALTLTLVLSAYFIVSGAFRVVAAVQNHGFTGWTWLLASGVLGLVLGIAIWLGWPGSALWVLGVLVGVELIFSGWAMVMLGSSARPA